jgi:hypothetical protein
MSYIPDCREDEVYNEKYLVDRDKQFVDGYDWCLECAVDNFWDNLGVYFGIDSAVRFFLDQKLPEKMRDEYEVEWKYFGADGDASSTRKVETIGDLLRSNMLDWVERQRNELITGMIDGMEPGKLREIKDRVDAEELRELSTGNKVTG